MKLIGWEEERKVIVVSWADKALKKAKKDKLVKEVLNDPRFKKQRQEENHEFLLKAYACMCMAALDYLFREFDFQQDKAKDFLDFVKKQERYMEQDSQYFNALNEALIDDVGFDVLEYMGLQAVDEEG